MLIKTVSTVALLWSCYSVLPTVYYKFIYQESSQKNELEFTFDDGPHPVYTERILDLLKQNNTHACFFVVGEKIEQYPEILQRIHREGHKIGLHCYHHTHPFFWGILKTKNDMQRTKIILQKYHIEPSYYRPPHGWMNLSMIFLCKRWNLPLKLWTAIVGDWNEDKNWKEICASIQEEGQKGGIICLHDSNHKLNSPSKAPQNTVLALTEYFKKIGDTNGNKI